MPKGSKKSNIQPESHVDEKKIREELMAKMQLDAEKERKRIEKQAMQRAKVEKLKQTNLEEQAAFISTSRKKTSEKTKNSKLNNNLEPAVEEKAKHENLVVISNENDYNGIWDETPSSSYQTANNTEHFSYQKQKGQPPNEESSYGSNKKNSEYSRKPQHLNQFNKTQNYKTNHNTPYGQVNENYKTNHNTPYGQVNGGSLLKVADGTDFEGIWGDDGDTSLDYQPISVKTAYDNNLQIFHQQKDQDNQNQRQTAHSQNYNGNSYRRNKGSQYSGTSTCSSTQSKFNGTQSEKYRRDSERSTTSSRFDNSASKNFHKPINTEADSSWDTSDWPTLNAAVPTVNVWEERKAKMEAIHQMAAHTDLEEEIMLQKALELSKQQAAEDQRRQRVIAKQYQLQQKYLEQNPQILSVIEQGTKVDSYEDEKDLEPKRRQVQALTRPSTKSPFPSSSQSVSSYCNGARPKYMPAVISTSSYRNSAQYDDDSPAEDGWEDCVENIVPPHKSTETISTQDKVGIEDTCSEKDDASVDSENVYSDFEGIENDEQSCDKASPEDKRDNIEWLLSSKEDSLSIIHDAVVSENGTGRSLEPIDNSKQHQFAEEKSSNVHGMRTHHSRDVAGNYSNGKNYADTSKSERNISSLKSHLSNHDKTPILQEGLLRSEENLHKQDSFHDKLSVLKLNDSTNITEAAAMPEVGDTSNGAIKTIDENCYYNSVAKVSSIEKWLESTIVNSGNAKYCGSVEKKVEFSKQFESDGKPDAALKSQVSHSMSCDPSSICPPTKSLVQVEVNVSANLTPNNQDNVNINSSNSNMVAVSASDMPFNPSFINPNSTMPFNPVMPQNLLFPNMSVLSPLELQQMLLISNSFFTRQLLLSQHYTQQMYQQSAGIHGAFNPSVGLIQPNAFQQAPAPTNVSQYSNLPEYFASTTSADFFTPGPPSTSTNTHVPQNVPNVLPSTFAQYKPDLNCMPMTMSSVPPGLRNNSVSVNMPNHMHMLNYEEEEVGIPPPKPANAMRQPKQSFSELRPLLQMTNMQHITEGIPAPKQNSNY